MTDVTSFRVLEGFDTGYQFTVFSLYFTELRSTHRSRALCLELKASGRSSTTEAAPHNASSLDPGQMYTPFSSDMHRISLETYGNVDSKKSG